MTATRPRMMKGYCFELDASAAPDPVASQDEDWDLGIYGPTGDEVPIGTRVIDGSACRVFLCPDGQYRAQMRVCTG